MIKGTLDDIYKDIKHKKRPVSRKKKTYPNVDTSWVLNKAAKRKRDKFSNRLELLKKRLLDHINSWQCSAHGSSDDTFCDCEERRAVMRRL